MKERPILFSGSMVRAILDGRKTQTRRVMKPQPPAKYRHLWPEFNRRGTVAPIGWFWSKETSGSGAEQQDLLGIHPCPYGRLGDGLWVRETWAVPKKHDRFAPSKLPKAALDRIWYAADDGNPPDWVGRLRPSIHMPRWASRITLRVVDVRVERVQEISEVDAAAEGVAGWPGQFEGQTYYQDYSKENWNVPQHTAAGSFRTLWDSINAARGHGWDANPWVWVVEFERVTP